MRLAKRAASSNALIIVGLALVLVSAFRLSSAADGAVALPDPSVDTPLAKAPGRETAVVAGGCFWGIQAVFQHVKGVKTALSGYSGGSANTANYEVVSTGTSGHAESVKITFDPSQVSYGQLLKVFFSVAHDPTQLNRQGPDEGTQYRSVIFYGGDEQKRIAEAYVAQLQQGRVFPTPVKTQLVPLKAFYEAEAYHQDYARLHPFDPYIRINDAPKADAPKGAPLKQHFPHLYESR